MSGPYPRLVGPSSQNPVIIVLKDARQQIPNLTSFGARTWAVAVPSESGVEPPALPSALGLHTSGRQATDKVESFKVAARREPRTAPRGSFEDDQNRGHVTNSLHDSSRLDKRAQHGLVPAAQATSTRCGLRRPPFIQRSCTIPVQ